jgi:hypothetical protein
VECHFVRVRLPRSFAASFSAPWAALQVAPQDLEGGQSGWRLRALHVGPPAAFPCATNGSCVGFSCNENMAGSRCSASTTGGQRVAARSLAVPTRGAPSLGSPPPLPAQPGIWGSIIPGIQLTDAGGLV